MLMVLIFGANPAIVATVPACPVMVVCTMLGAVFVIVTAPVAPLTEIPVLATFEVTPALVTVTVPDVPPPDIPVPAVTPVISPVFAVALAAIPSSLVLSVLVKLFCEIMR